MCVKLCCRDKVILTRSVLVCSTSHCCILIHELALPKLSSAKTAKCRQVTTFSTVLHGICRPHLIVWWLRGNIFRTALCWIVWHNVHCQQHTYVSSFYASNRLGLAHWDPYVVRRGGNFCLELYYCNIMEWFRWDSSLIFDDQLVSFSALTLLVWSSGL